MAEPEKGRESMREAKTIQPGIKVSLAQLSPNSTKTKLNFRDSSDHRFIGLIIFAVFLWKETKLNPSELVSSMRQNAMFFSGEHCKLSVVRSCFLPVLVNFRILYRWTHHDCSSNWMSTCQVLNIFVLHCFEAMMIPMRWNLAGDRKSSQSHCEQMVANLQKMYYVWHFLQFTVQLKQGSKVD